VAGLRSSQEDSSDGAVEPIVTKAAGTSVSTVESGLICLFLRYN